MKSLVSIIIPVYGVQDHIEKCMHSLLLQSYGNIEYVVVDDCTPDKSIEIVERIIGLYSDRKSSVKIIKHNQNKGLPAARNTGLAEAKGEYIFHCDSDDWIESNMIADMVEVAERDDVDIVYTDFYLSFHQNQRYMSQPTHDNPEKCIGAMLSGKMKFNVWNKLVRTNLYTENNIFFPEGRSMGEDMAMFKLFCHAKRAKHIPKAYYHYMQTNPNAFTKRMSQKQLDDILFNVTESENYIKQVKGQELYKSELNYFKLNMKLPFLMSLDKSLYKLWREWFPESNAFIGLNSDFSIRIKLLQYAAIRKQDWFIKLYNRIVVNFIYGIVYR